MGAAPDDDPAALIQGARPQWLPGLALILGDVAVLELSVALAIEARVALSFLMPIDMNPALFTGVAFTLLFLPIAYGAVGLYPGYGMTGVERLGKRVTVTTLCFGGLIIFDYIAQKGQWSRGVLLGAGLIAVIAVPLADAIMRRLLRAMGQWGETVVILGAPDRRAAIVRSLREHAELGWIPLTGDDIETERREGAPRRLAIVAAGLDAMSALGDDLPYQRVVFVPDVDGVQTLWATTRDLGIGLGIEMRRNLLIPRNQIVKRVIDVIIGLIAAILTAPLVILACALIMLVSPGSPIFVQTRIGRQGRPFAMLKLRTMRPGADRLLDDMLASSPDRRAEWSSSMKLRDDPRILPLIGALLRRFSVDELPQLLNVLRGDMSLVGPRPLPAYHQGALNAATDRLRRRVRPGITGLWQVSGRSDTGLEAQNRLDSYYVRNWSLWLDIHILARTVLVVLYGRGAR